MTAQDRARRATALVAAIAVAASIAGILNSFTQDDVSIIVESSRLHSLASLRDIFTLPYWPPPAAPDLYRPVLSVLLALQYAVGGGAPVVFHAVSCALYALASVAVYKLLRRVAPETPALVMAVLFAANPVHVEAVALAVSQNELIVAALTALAVIRYVDRRRSAGELRARDWTLIAASYVGSALAKEQGLLLPGFLLLAEATVVPDRPLIDRVRSVAAGYTALAVLGAAMLVARTAVLHGVVGPSMLAEALRGQSLGGRALTMLQIVPQWVRLFVWPAHLRAEYSPREFVVSNSFGAREALGLVIVAAALAAAWLARRRAPPVTFGLAWCALALFPVSNVVIPTGILVAERTLFLPSVGVAVAAAGAIAYASSRWPQAVVRSRAVLATATIVLVILGLARSAERQRVWRDPRSLTIASVEDSPRSWRVQQAYGDMLFADGHVADAIAAFRRAIDLAPEPWRPKNFLAERLRMIGDDSDAVMVLRSSLADDPRQIQTVVALTPALIGAGRYHEAKQLADSIIAAEDAPPVMVQLSRLADSAAKADAPAGSIRIGVPRQ